MKKKRKIFLKNENGNGIKLNLDLIFSTEIWSLLFSLLTQDFLFFIIRLIVLIYYESTSKNYTLYFFVVKNFILCIFQIYRIIVIIIEEFQENQNQDNLESSNENI